MSQKIKEVKIYRFKCGRCNNARRQSVNKAIAQIGICRTCRNILLANKDQILLIEEDEKGKRDYKAIDPMKREVVEVKDKNGNTKSIILKENAAI